MNDKKIIITGLTIFVVIMLFPFLWNITTRLVEGAAPVPEPVLSEKAKAAGYCVMPKEEMKAEHMQILDHWRDVVVREGDRVYEAANGKKFNMSLSTGDESCMGCHSNKTEFCDKCHDYASVRPYCWDCHNEPKEK